MADNPRRSRRIRLAGDAYADEGTICSVTIGVKDRAPVFEDPLVADAAVQVLRALAQRTQVPIYAWCVMPDHVHLVLGPSPTCDIVTFVGQFKNLAQRAAWRLGVAGAFWQKSFWDHFLRREERIEVVVRYVLENPIRRGQVERWEDYPFSGSLELDLATLT